MTVTALDGVQRFVMQYGRHVQVVQPTKLSQAIQAEIAAMQSTYAEGDKQ